MAGGSLSATVVFSWRPGFSDNESNEHSVFFRLFAGRWMGDRLFAQHARQLVRKQERQQDYISVGLQISKVIKIGPLPVKLAVQPQYMPVHPDLFGQKWNLQFAITPVIPKLIKGNLLEDW